MRMIYYVHLMLLNSILILSLYPNIIRPRFRIVSIIPLLTSSYQQYQSIFVFEREKIIPPSATN